MAKAHSVPFIEVSAKEDVNIQQLFALIVCNTKPMVQPAPVPAVMQARPVEERSGCTIM